MIRIDGTRFGDIEVEETSVICFANGLIGFPNETRFVLLEREKGRLVGFLQSLDTPALAFPVTDGSAFAGYPEPPADVLARSVGLGETDLALFVIVSATSKRELAANLLAPLIVDVATRAGAQVVLDPRMYSAATPLGDPIAMARARMEAIKNSPPSEPPADRERVEQSERAAAPELVSSRPAHKAPIAAGM
ncbi:MAG: hypothetical protein EXR75_12775 [Myxococcales bacterium]|nr:hypothetical protein [Myxococcales bacterium]